MNKITAKPEKRDMGQLRYKSEAWNAPGVQGARFSQLQHKSKREMQNAEQIRSLIDDET